jgi:hypothetical protein
VQSKLSLSLSTSHESQAKQNLIVFITVSSLFEFNQSTFEKILGNIKIIRLDSHGK